MSGITTSSRSGPVSVLLAVLDLVLRSTSSSHCSDGNHDFVFFSVVEFCCLEPSFVHFAGYVSDSMAMYQHILWVNLADIHLLVDGMRDGLSVPL